MTQNTTAPIVGITNSTGTTTLNCTTTSINVTATGGTSYTWSGGLGNLATATITNPGTYTVTATGANGCSSQSVITVTQNTTAPIVGITNSTGTSTLNCTTTSINVTATGATSYTWSGGLGSLATATITNPGSYTVTATGANGCSSQSVITVTQNTTAPIVGITNSTGTTTLNCTTTSINVTATGGTSYTWSGGLGNLATATITNPGTYTVTATGANGCSSQSVITVTQNTTAPIVGITNSTGTTTLNCTTTSINVTATGGTSYTWSGGLGNLATATITNPGTYTVTATGANGCSSQSVITVTQNATAPIVIASSSSSSICAGSSVTLTAFGATSYTWNPGNFSGSTLTVSPTTTTIYTLTGLSANGCSNTTTLNLTVNSIPILTLTASSTTVCSGGTITLTASGASTYTWDPGSLTGSSITSTITSTTVYSVTGESSEGCIGSSSITVSLNNCPTAVNDATNTIQNTPVTGNAAVNDSETIGGTFTTGQPSPGTGTITMNPATGQYTYTPSTGFTGTTSITYTLCNGAPTICSTAVITITVFPTLVANPDAVTTTPSVSTTGTLTTNDNGVVPGATYSVSVTQLPPSTGTITINPATGQYTFTPNPTYTGSTTTTYTICNTSVNPIVCSSTTISISVGNLPVAVADASTTIVNTPVSGDVSSNDSGAIPSLNPVFTSGPLSVGTGTLVMNPTTGQYTYTPATGFTGTTIATYTLCNLSSPPCSTASITFTVYPTLIAVNDPIVTTPSVTTTGTLTGNDIGLVPGGSYTTIATPFSPTTGTITVNPATGQYTFVPNPTFTGTAQTTYTVCQYVPPSTLALQCSTATITVNITNILAVNDETVTLINLPVSGNLGTNDLNATGGTYVITNQPLNGTVTVNPATGQYTFTPAPSFTGVTTATYVVCNPAPTNCSSATITFTVYPTLIAVNDPIVTTPSVTTTGTLTGNDIGLVPGGSYTTIATPFSPTTGTITVNPATGQYTFVPNPTFTGTAQTTYTVCQYVPPSIIPIQCSTATITVIVGNSLIGTAKSVSTPTYNTDGTISLNYRITVKNYGSLALTNVSVADNLTNTFPSPATYTITNAPVVTTTLGTQLAIDNLYTGAGSNTVMTLPLTSSLAVGRTDTVSFDVKVSLNGFTGSFNNFAIVSANSGTISLVDTSSSGNNPDPNNNGNPNDDDEPTIFTPTIVKIGLAKMAGKVESDGTGCNRVTFKFTIKNYGVSPVYNVSLIDNLDNTFINPATYSVVSAPVSITGALATNALFSGNGNNTNLLTSTNSLSIGGVDTIMVKVRFCSNGGVTTYSNIAVVSANSSSTGLGNTGTDISTNGLNPDPNGNGNPSDNDEGIVTVFSGSDVGVIVPQGFNPNDVNGNQTWILKGIENFPDNVVSVYNRWGNLVYQKEGYSNAEAWNGIANSNLPILGANRLPQGTYYYVIEFKNSDQAALKGFVVLQY